MLLILTNFFFFISIPLLYWGLKAGLPDGKCQDRFPPPPPVRKTDPISHNTQPRFLMQPLEETAIVGFFMCVFLNSLANARNTIKGQEVRNENNQVLLTVTFWECYKTSLLLIPHLCASVSSSPLYHLLPPPFLSHKAFIRLGSKWGNVCGEMVSKERHHIKSILIANSQGCWGFGLAGFINYLTACFLQKLFLSVNYTFFLLNNNVKAFLAHFLAMINLICLSLLKVHFLSSRLIHPDRLVNAPWLFSNFD